jgi:ribonuclease E
VTYYLLNRKKQELARIERDYDIEVTVKGKPSFLMNQLEIEHLKREKLPHAEHAEQVAESIPPFDALPTDLPDEKKAPAAALPGEEKGRKKRQRGKKVREEAGSPEPEVPQVLAPVTEPESDVPEQLPEEEAHAEGAKKKKRRRRRRKGSGEAGESVAETTSFNLSVSPVAVAESVDAVPVEEKTEGAEAGEGAKKKKRRRRRRGKGQGGEVSQDVSAAAEVPAAGPADVKSVEQMADDTAQGEPHPQEATPARPKRGGRKKGPAAEAGTQTLKDAPLPDPGPSATEVPPAAAGAESVPTPLRPRKPKKSVAPVPSPDVAAEPIPEAAEQKVRPPAKKRVKKSEPLEQTASGDTPAVVAAEEQPPAPKKVRVARKRPEK